MAPVTWKVLDLEYIHSYIKSLQGSRQAHPRFLRPKWQKANTGLYPAFGLIGFVIWDVSWLCFFICLFDTPGGRTLLEGRTFFGLVAATDVSRILLFLSVGFVGIVPFSVCYCAWVRDIEIFDSVSDWCQRLRAKLSRKPPLPEVLLVGSFPYGIFLVALLVLNWYWTVASVLLIVLFYVTGLLLSLSLAALYQHPSDARLFASRLFTRAVLVDDLRREIDRRQAIRAANAASRRPGRLVERAFCPQCNAVLSPSDGSGVQECLHCNWSSRHREDDGEDKP